MPRIPKTRSSGSTTMPQGEHTELTAKEQLHEATR